MKRPIQAVYLGCIGHYILGDRCRFRLHTQIGTMFRVSTVGDMHSSPDSERSTVAGYGPNDPPPYFETMVLRTTKRRVKGNDGCGCLEPQSRSYSNPEKRALYSTAGAATAGHRQLVQIYTRIARLRATS